MQKPTFGVIVHAGAGYHSEAKRAQYELACQHACKAAIDCLRSGLSAVDAVEKALMSLEDAPLTNAGFGSTLNFDGNVECDACVACSKTGYFGGVGSVAGVRNPSTVAAALLRQQVDHPTLELGRIPPSVLVGEGARKWALEKRLAVVPPRELISKESQESYCKYRRRLKRYRQSLETAGQAKRARTEEDNFDSEGPSSRLDTIGVVCVDADGHIVAGASSGGIALKCPGRVGQACMPGAGCWAEERGGEAVGSATTGAGEHLMRTLLAMRAAVACFHKEEMPVDSLNRCLKEEFLAARALSEIAERNAGVIVLRTHAPVNGFGPQLEFVFAHTTPSMSVGYMSSKCKRPSVLISRANADAGRQAVTIGGRVITC